MLGTAAGNNKTLLFESSSFFILGSLHPVRSIGPREETQNGVESHGNYKLSSYETPVGMGQSCCRPRSSMITKNA